MSYKYSKGNQVIGDLSGSDDPERNTGIDFEDDFIGFETSGSLTMVVSGSNVGVGITAPNSKLHVDGDIKATGRINAKQRFINTAKYTESSTDQKYVRWDAAGSNGAPGVNNKFLAPCDGELLSVTIRATSVANGTNIAFHTASNGTENLNTTAVETVGVDMSAANTTYQAQFSGSTFSAGDILGISLDPTNGFGNVNIACVWLFDWNS